MRGMEWVGRKVFERGYWKSTEDRRVEIEVLDIKEGNQLTDSIIQDEDADERDSGLGNETARRWTGIMCTAVNLAGFVDSFTWVEGICNRKVDSVLEAKVHSWRDKDHHECEQQGRRWTDNIMDVNVNNAEVNESLEGEDDEEGSEEVKVLKVKVSLTHCRLGSNACSHSDNIRDPCLHSVQQPLLFDTAVETASTVASHIYSHVECCSGFSILVLDTNILLSSLSVIVSIIESLRWTIIIPVPVIMELEGLSSNTSQLGEAAQEAVAPHSDCT